MTNQTPYEPTGTTTGPGPQPGYPYPTPAYRPLRRSRSQRVLGGVCGGLAEYLRVDPVVVRVVTVLLAVFGGTTLLLYVVGWLFIPEEGQSQSVVQRAFGMTPPAGAGQP